MKKTLFIVALLSSFLSFSQTIKKTTFGIKAGLNFSDVVGVESDGDKTGYVGTEIYGSLFVDTELNENWNLENELLFSYTDDYHFLEIPVHLKYKFLKNWNFLFGPKIDFILDNDNDPFESSSYRFKNFGVSIEVGTQYYISKRLFAELRYSKGLTQQIDDLVFDINKGKRNTLRIGIGIKF
jgi:hypothetical protein